MKKRTALETHYLLRYRPVKFTKIHKNSNVTCHGWKYVSQKYRTNFKREYLENGST